MSGFGVVVVDTTVVYLPPMMPPLLSNTKLMLTTVGHTNRLESDTLILWSCSKIDLNADDLLDPIVARSATASMS